MKRQRIDESGGVRPRVNTTTTSIKDDDGKKDGSSSSPGTKNRRSNFNNNNQNHHHQSKHRFGRVMEQVPCRNKPRYSTVSIALPGSVLSNCQTKELRTLLVGQIARAATIYHVDEIIVFDDKLANNNNSSSNNNNHHYRSGSGWREFKRQKPNSNDGQPSPEAEEKTTEEKGDTGRDNQRSNPQEFMARLLQFCECPQYLRRGFFPMHPDLQFVGLLAPVDAPHHVRADDRCKYREGVVLNKTGPNGKSLVNCGIRNRPVE
jgi:predicted SPOUT superfamily RNA methylase MTH1